MCLVVELFVSFLAQSALSPDLVLNRYLSQLWISILLSVVPIFQDFNIDISVCMHRVEGFTPVGLSSAVHRDAANHLSPSLSHITSAATLRLSHTQCGYRVED